MREWRGVKRGMWLVCGVFFFSSLLAANWFGQYPRKRKNTQCRRTRRTRNNLTHEQQGIPDCCTFVLLLWYSSYSFSFPSLSFSCLHAEVLFHFYVCLTLQVFFPFLPLHPLHSLLIPLSHFFPLQKLTH